MQFVVVFTPSSRFASSGLPADFADRQREEQEHVRELLNDGRLRNIWMLGGPDTGALQLLEVESREELDAMLAEAPFAKLDYTEHRVYQLDPYAF